MVRRRFFSAVSNHEMIVILRDAVQIVIGPAKPDPLDAAPQDEENSESISISTCPGART
jgi:hypothetical protein